MSPRAKAATPKSDKPKQPATPRKPRKAKPEPGSLGLTAGECAAGTPTPEVTRVRTAIEEAGGSVLACYREPFGGHWVALETVVALVMPEPEIAFRILALNTEKAHNLKDKAIEVIRMARAIAVDPKRAGQSEADVAFELEQASLVTLGICYEKNARFSGGAYNSVVSKCETFSTDPMKKSLVLREKHADKLLDLDEEVTTAVGRLKEAGWNSGYLKPIVVARINPLRFLKPGKDDAAPDFDKTIDKMIEGAKKFDASKVKAQDVAIASAVGGGSDETN